jgi:hypothetical protein
MAGMDGEGGEPGNENSLVYRPLYEKDDLTPKEKKMLAELAKTARQEAVDAFRRGGGKS